MLPVPVSTHCSEDMLFLCANAPGVGSSFNSQINMPPQICCLSIWLTKIGKYLRKEKNNSCYYIYFFWAGDLV